MVSSSPSVLTELCRLSTVEQGPKLPTSFTSSFVKFTVPGKRNRKVQYMLLTQNEADITSQAGSPDDVRKARLYKLGNNQVTSLRQTLFLGQVMSAKTFTVAGKLYLAVLASQSSNQLSDRGSITVYAWNGKRFRRSPQQHLAQVRDGARSIDTFVVNGVPYMALVGAKAEQDKYGTWLSVYKWSNHEVESGQFHLAFDHDFAEATLPGQPQLPEIKADASHVHYFSLHVYHFLSVSVNYDGKSTRTKSYLFQLHVTCPQLFGCVTLREHQSFQTVGAASSQFFSFYSGIYLMFANSFNSDVGTPQNPTLDNYRVPSSIYRLNFHTQLFEPFQEVPTLGASSVKFFTVCKELYIAVSSRLVNESLARQDATLQNRPYGEPARRTGIYRWRGIEKFQPWLHFPVSHRTWSVDIMESSGTKYLAESYVDEHGVPGSRLLELRTNGGECVDDAP